MLFLGVHKQLLNNSNALSILLGMGDILVITNNCMPTIVGGLLGNDTEYHHGIYHEDLSFSEGSHKCMKEHCKL